MHGKLFPQERAQYVAHHTVLPAVTIAPICIGENVGFVQLIGEDDRILAEVSQHTAELGTYCAFNRPPTTLVRQYAPRVYQGANCQLVNEIAWVFQVP